MTKRTIALLVGLALSPATIEGLQPGNSITVQAFEGLSAPTSRVQTAPPAPKPVTWEYKILNGVVPSLVRMMPADGRIYPRANLEEDINRLSAQGYVVESFQTLCSVEGVRSGSSIMPSGPLEVVVLMKRMRK